MEINYKGDREGAYLDAAPRLPRAARRLLEEFTRAVAAGSQPSERVLQFVAQRITAVLAIGKTDSAGPYRRALLLSDRRGGRPSDPRTFRRHAEMALALCTRLAELRAARRAGLYKYKLSPKEQALLLVARDFKRAPATVRKASEEYWRVIRSL